MPFYNLKQYQSSTMYCLIQSLSENQIYSEKAVIFRIANRIDDMLLLLHLLEQGTSIVLVSPDCHINELNWIQNQLSTKYLIQINSTGKLCIQSLKFKDNKRETILKEKGVYLLSSGTTGKPKLIFRSEISLLQEAYRYQFGLSIDKRDIITIPLPIYHAYALGWLFAAVISNAYVKLSEPHHLGVTQQAIYNDSTIVILSTTLAHLLVQRGQRVGKKASKLLRFVMVGAGPVSNKLEKDFNKVFGIGLARNYGSTETGALFAGLPPQKPYCVGKALPGVKYRIVPFEENQLIHTGLLEIKHNGHWYPLCDIVEKNESNSLKIIGRETTSIRRGDSFISSFEIEDTIKKLDTVKDVSIKTYKTKYPGHERIVANIVLIKNNQQFCEITFKKQLANYLSASKIPDEFIIVNSIERDINGKVISNNS